MANIVYKEPFKAFRFLVELEGSGQKTVVAAFSQFSGVKMHTHVVQVRPGSDFRGVAEYVPATTAFENVTLTKGVIGDNEFFDWILSCAPGATTPPTGKNKYRTLNIVALDEHGKRGVTWSLIDALPVSYELAPLDGAQSAVLTETMEFAITGFKRTAQPEQTGGR